MEIIDNKNNYNENNKQHNDNNKETKIQLQITENISKIGISGISVNKDIFEFSIIDKSICYIPFNPNKTPITNLGKDIRNKISRKLEKYIQNTKTFESAIYDIEDKIIENRDKIFLTSSFDNNNDNTIDDEFKAKFIDEVTELRNKNLLTYEQWQSNVTQKYNQLKKVIEKHYPEAWIFMEFCLSVKSILNIQEFTLPFMGVIVAPPSSMKTMVIHLFRKYPNSFYTDSFTPSSIVSHNSSLNEEELQKVDLLPKIKDRLVLTPELAPIVTAKDDELQKMMGIIIRLLDGHGLETDSGAHGHRKYGDTMFVWLGAIVEIQPRVWKLLGTLGNKIYFIRPALRKKTPAELKKIAKKNNFSDINKEIESALLEYLKTFDAAPQIEGKTKIENEIVKIRWNEEFEQEQDIALEYLAQLANLLARIRGIVNVSDTGFITNNKYNKDNNYGSNQKQQTEGQEYSTDFPIIEDPSRAVILLRNIAIGHAVSQGRDHLSISDIPIAIKVALSTAPLRRVKVLDLLLRKGYNGEITTSQITHHLSISQPIATKTMRELDALGIAKIFTVGNYSNSELKIKLKSEFEWFKSPQFLKLKEEFVPTYEDEFENQIDSINEYAVNNNKIDKDNDDSSPNHDILTLINNNFENSKENDGNIKACDNKIICHTLKENLPSEGDIENKACDNKKEIKEQLQLGIGDNNSFNNFKLQDQLLQQNNVDLTIIKSHNLYDNTNSNITTSSTTINADSSTENISSSPSTVSLEHVTESNEVVCHTPSGLSIENNDSAFNSVLHELLDFTKLSNGSSISFNSAIQSICKNNEVTRNYLGDKLTARENRSVRDLYIKVIRHPNIEVIKHKPQLLIKWKEDDLSNKGEV
jgi:hypothetical protein